MTIRPEQHQAHRPHRPRRPRWLARRVAAFVAAAVVTGPGLSGCGALDKGAYNLPLPGGAAVGTDPTSITAHFGTVEGLVPKSNVKMDNVAVGRVDSIDVDRQTWTAVVRLTVRNDLDLPTDVEARVRRSSLLGEWYVELVRPTPPDPTDSTSSTGETAGGAGATTAARSDVVAPGSEIDIPLTRTGGTAAVEDVLGALSLLLNNGGLPQANSIITELNRALDGNETQVRALLGDLTTFVSTLDDRRDDIVAALDGLADLSRTLKDNRSKIATALQELPDGLRVLADQRPQLTEMLRSLDRLSTVAVDVIARSKDDTIADLELLRPVLRSLEASGSDLTDALEIIATFPFTPGARDAVQGDYLNLDAKVDLDLDTVLSTLLASNQPLNLGGQDIPNPLPLLEDPTQLLDQLTDELNLPGPVRDLTGAVGSTLGGLTPKETAGRRPAGGGR